MIRSEPLSESESSCDEPQLIFPIDIDSADFDRSLIMEEQHNQIEILERAVTFKTKTEVNIKNE